MKRYLYIIVALAATAFMASCLDENPKDQMDEEQAYDTPQNVYINAVATLYNYIGSSEECQGLQGTCRGVYDYNTFTTDEAIIPIRGGDWYDGGLWDNMYAHKWNANDISLYNTWLYLYKVVVLANKSIGVINSHASILSEQQRSSYEAEVRAVRAMFYYYIMDMFGRVPLVTAADATLADCVQSERSRTFRFVFDELQAVAPLLPEGRSNQPGDNYGRMTQAVAYFLLAKLALNAEVYSDDDWTDGTRTLGRDIYFDVDGQRLNAWQTCVAYCDKLADMGYSLEEDYAYNFSVHNENSQENIFTIPADKNIYAAQFHYLFRSRHYNHGMAVGTLSENGPCATISTMNAYGYGTSHPDARLEKNFYTGKVVVDGKDVMLDNGEPLVYMPLAVERNLTNSPYIQTAGARMAKYEVDRTAYIDGKLQDNDIVLFRYADALLMKAEAKVRGGEDGSAELNAVRSRVGMPALPATLDNILRERLLELVWEGWRRQDLVRFGLFTSSYDLREPIDEEETGFTTVFPIPQKSLDLNRQLQQNKGY